MDEPRAAGGQAPISVVGVTTHQGAWAAAPGGSDVE